MLRPSGLVGSSKSKSPPKPLPGFVTDRRYALLMHSSQPAGEGQLVFISNAAGQLEPPSQSFCADDTGPLSSRL